MIEFRDVVKRFDGADGAVQTVLDHVSFTVPQGKTTVIAGGSGQGKSVTVKLILGLLSINSGDILVDGESIIGLSRKKLESFRSRCGVLFQGGALFDSMSVYDNVALPLRERTSYSEKEIAEKVMAGLAQLDLEGHQKKYPSQLSGGMLKRVSLARALQLRPDIMLFDEPTTGLDPVMSQEIYQIFSKMQHETGFTSIIVSHDIPKVLELADQVVILEKGSVDVFADVEAMKRSKKEHIQKFVMATMGESLLTR